MEERNGLEVSFQRRLCFSLSIPANNLNWSRRCRVQSRAPLLPLLEKKTFSDHRRKKSSPSLSPLSFRLSMISCLTDGWDGKDDGAMVNVVEKLAQKPASPLVPSRHMKLSLDDLKALQEHIKDLLGPKDLKKPTNQHTTNMIDVFAMKLSTPSPSWSPIAFHFCLKMSPRTKLCFQSLRRGAKMYFWLLPAVLSMATLIDGCHYTDIVVRFEPH